MNTVDVRPSLSDLRFFESAKGASMQDEDDDNQGRNPFKRGDKVIYMYRCVLFLLARVCRCMTKTVSCAQPFLVVLIIFTFLNDVV